MWLIFPNDFEDKAKELARKAQELAKDALSVGQGAGVAIAVLSLPMLAYLFSKKKK